MFQPRSWELSFKDGEEKSRNRKPRDKFSCLWFMPSKVLNMREEMLSERSKIVKGKRMGSEIFRQLSCKVCRRTFYKLLNWSNSELDNRITITDMKYFNMKKGHSVVSHLFPHPPRLRSKEKFGQKKGEFEDWNRTFVQMVMGRGFMKKVHCIELSEPDPPTFKDSSTRCIEASLFYTLEALN